MNHQISREFLGKMAVVGAMIGFAGGAPTDLHARTLVYCASGSPGTFGPAVAIDWVSHEAGAQQIFDRLVDTAYGSPEPALAESWEVSDDGTTYTFHLRQGVKFQGNEAFTPSRDFNAEDVVFSFERQFKADHPYHNVSGGSYEDFNYMGMPALLESIERVDGNTIKFVLTRPDSTFITLLSMDFASVYSQEQAGQMLREGRLEVLDLMPVGTGPFQLVEYQKDAVIKYRANSDYWRGRAAIDDLVFSITPDAAVRAHKLEAGECQVMTYPDLSDVDRLRKNSDIEVFEQPAPNVGYLAFNVTQTPFNDKRVRQAINLAIDKEAIIKSIYQGAGTPAKNPIPPTIWSYDDSVPAYPYDVERAKALLSQAGVSNLSTDLWYMPVQRPYNPDARTIAELVRADLANIGITVELKTYEWAEYLRRVRAGEHQMGMLGWAGDNSDPDNFMSALLSCNSVRDGGTNIAKWCNEEFTDLIDEARVTFDQGRRTELYKTAQRIFHEEAPWVPIAHSVIFVPMRKDVEGIQIDTLGRLAFYPVGKPRPDNCPMTCNWDDVDDKCTCP